MESSDEFKIAFVFLEHDFEMLLTHFDYAENHFGNILAEYKGSSITIRLVRDRGILETQLSKDGVTWHYLDALLQDIGQPPSITMSSAGWPIGADAAGQSDALRKHLPSICRHLVGA